MSIFEKITHIELVKNWYLKYERPLSSFALVGGFIFDWFTLKRVDMFWENIWTIFHLLVAAIGIIWINTYKNDKKTLEESRMHFWLLMAIQFGFGGLLGTFLVFYFRSSTFASSWPFLLLLAITFACNEGLKKHYSRLSFQITVLFISIYSFAIFYVPLLFHKIGDGIFILSGIISLVLLGLFLYLLSYITEEHFKKSKRILFVSISGVFVLINILYFTNLIPPLPLSLKEGAVAHSITKTPDDNYVLQSEEGSWRDYFRSYEIYHHVAGKPVYVYSAVFSPTNLNTRIIHHWQYYDEAKKEWISAGRVVLPIVGGRDDGFRTYSQKSSVHPGLWRVDVETERGQDIGRIKFKI